MHTPLHDLVGCSQCGGPTENQGQLYRCNACGLEWATDGRIVFNRQQGDAAVFDTLFEQMQTGNQEDEVWKFCYEQQSNLALSMMNPGSVVLDVGCGPALAYRKPPGVGVIGVDPSLPSLRANPSIDLAIWGSASSLPLRNGSVDLVFCFYSVHHMVGNTQAETHHIVSRVFKELARVVKRGGSIAVFDMNPWYPAWIFERLFWNSAKRVLADKLDMYFWRANDLTRLVQKPLGGAMPRVSTFTSSPFNTFPPIFSVPWFRVPRFLYPMDPKGYTWTLH